jgi:hypothetical protein
MNLLSVELLNTSNVIQRKILFMYNIIENVRLRWPVSPKRRVVEKKVVNSYNDPLRRTKN